MGHQLNFHAAPPDVARLEAAISALQPILILHDRSSMSEPRVLPTLTFKENSQQHLFYFLVRPDDLSDVVMEHVPNQGYWSVDILRSPVIEFTSCYFDGQILRRGRIYYVDGYYGADDAWMEKPETFRRWAAAVRKTVRKELTKRDSDYIGEEAALWLEREAGRLVV